MEMNMLVKLGRSKTVVATMKKQENENMLCDCSLCNKESA